MTIRHALQVVAILALAVNTAKATDGIYITAGTSLGSGTSMNFYIENSSGQRTGQLADGSYVSQIPGTRGRYSSPTLSNETEPDQQRTEFHCARFPAGTYKLVLIPQGTAPYYVMFNKRNSNNVEISQTLEGFGENGTPITLNFEHQPAASSPTATVKEVTFASLRKGVQLTHTAQGLGDDSFASRLDKMIIKAADQAGKGQKKQAADRLDQFIHRLDSAFKKEPDPNADDDPSDKKSADSMKRFIMEPALDSLRDDARTLIVSLGETPKR